jgi:UDP-glucose 4-epimerase
LACVQIAASSADPLHDLRVNAESTLRLPDHIRKTDLPLLERFVYTSSCSVYGNSSNNFPAREEGAVAPLSHYAASKLLGENYTRIYNSQYGLPTSVVRYSNVYGYWQTPKNPYCGVLGKFIHNALLDKPCSIIGDGEQTRDYTFVTDAIKATLLAATHPRAIGESFNIGTGRETSVNQLVEILKTLKSDISIEHLPERDIDNIRRRVIDAETIHTKLGWAPEVDIKRGLEETFNWYKKNLSR